MAPTAKTKTAASCWTCRIRHKKCDESLPTCRNCQALELSCLYSNHKPAWMDNGDKQREMAQRLKTQVKRNAKERRGRRMIQKITREIEGHSPSSPSNPPSLSPGRDEHSADSIQESVTVDHTTVARPTTPSHTLPFHSAPTTEVLPDQSQNDQPTLFFSSDAALGPLVVQNEQDLRFVTAYTDYIFPLLNPFYRPSFLEGGRSWLLVFAMRNTESCQLVISLATYFVSVVPIYPGPGHTACSSHTWREVQSQSDLAVRGMQQRVETISRCGVSGNLLQSTHLLGDIMLLLKFETMTGSCSSWSVHLSAATVLFEQFLSSPDLDDIIWKIPSHVEDLLSIATSAPSTKDAHRFEASQTAFRFFSAAVLIADIISSTALGQLPRLREHHERVLGTREKPHLNLKHIVGCENWVFLSISDIVELDLWKKKAKKSGAFSLMDLIQRASRITQDLDNGLANSSSSDDENACNKDGIFSIFTPQRGESIHLDIVTRIWANAARLYLLVVLSGWQPGSSEIREIVSKNLDLLKNLPCPSWLLALAWSFCVTGCLVTKELESVVCDIYEATEPLKNIGPISEAMGIIRHVWEQREGLIGETWDMASCFGSMGRAVLLI